MKYRDMLLNTGDIPMLAPARPDGFAQRRQLSAGPEKIGLPPGADGVL